MMNKFCSTHNITERQFLGLDKISGSLYLNGLTAIPKGFSPTVGGSLYLNGLTAIPKGFSPTVGGSLYLNGLTAIPKGFSPTVGGSLYLNGLTTIPEGFNPTVGGGLLLNGLTAIPKGFSPTVGGWLFLNGLTTIPKGFNPTVGGSLYLNGLTSIPKGFNPTVGGDVELNGLTSIPEGFNKDSFRTLFQSWQDEKYICVDGVFTEVLKRKRNVWKVKKILTDREFYLVTDGQGKFAHGETVKEARADLLFKLSDNADKENYAKYTVFTLAEAIECYRLVTGACVFGVKDFVANHEMKEVFEVSDIITMTEGYYGHETFKAFFSK